jgi:bifunctional enzyme CysN/CysC/sulfate adenylyltransferase subunit 1
MLSGASGAKVAILVVSIEEGIREQTIDHLEIAKILGIEQLGVAVNKMGKVNYRKEKFEEIVSILKKHLSEIGYSLENVKFFPVSALLGENVVKKSEKMDWYNGETIMEFLEREIKEENLLQNYPFQFLVQDVYDEVVIGKVESGKVKKGDMILVLPQNKISKITKILDGEEEIDKAETGESVGIVLEENFEMKRGDVISSVNSGLKTVSRLSGKIFWIKIPSQKDLIIECGTARSNGKINQPGSINAGERSNYEILLEKPLVVEPRGKTILSKIVLKDKGEIIAVGNIL